MPDHHQHAPDPALVVIVNDEPSQLACLDSFARKTGMQTRTFTAAIEALEAMDDGLVPDLIVTDLNMPGMDGWRFCALLRSRAYPALNTVPVLVVSAVFSSEETKRATTDMGIQGFLPAPVDAAEFIATINTLVAGGSATLPPRALVADADGEHGAALQAAFIAGGYQADHVRSLSEARSLIDTFGYDAAVVDQQLADGDGGTLLPLLLTQRPPCYCIMTTADPAPQQALDWLRQGAAAYLRKPYLCDYALEVCARIRRARALHDMQELLKTRTEELQHSEQRFHTLLHNISSVAVQGYDSQGRVCYWNRASELLYGYSSTEALGQPLIDLIIPPALRETVAAHIKRMLASGDGGPAEELQLQDRHGNPVWVFSHHAVVDVPGQGRQLFCIDVDIGRRRQAEAEHARLQEMLNQAQKMEAVGRLAGGVAHDFNNMLSVIMGYLQLAARMTSADDAIHRHLDHALDAARRSADLTRQLLAFARKQVIAPQVLDLNRTIDNTMTILRRLIGEHIDLRWQPQPQPTPIFMDPSQVDQILANLCVNARDAIAGHGSITISTTIIDCSPQDCAGHEGVSPGPFVRLGVSDDGCGMDQEILDHLFEPFFTTKALGTGTGLGLATIHGIVAQNHGFITVASQPGQGTRFDVHLPLHDRDPSGRHPTLTQQTAAGQETILVVEDEGAVLDVAVLILQQLGYHTLHTRDPLRAIEMVAASHRPIDLLLSDVIMPELNGRELYQRLRADHPQMACLYMSGYTADVIGNQGILGDDVAILHKPFTQESLASQVRKVLDGRNSARTGGAGNDGSS